jgi:hypothetical protein
VDNSLDVLLRNKNLQVDYRRESVKFLRMNLVFEMMFVPLRCLYRGSAPYSGIR